MAVWTMLPKNVIKYGEDTVASATIKTIGNFEHLFELINLLHSGEDIDSSSDDSLSKPGDLKINSEDNGIYMRNNDNTAWVLIGYVSKNFGITPEKIGAVKNGGGLGVFRAGLETAMSNLTTADLNTNDIYFAVDTFRAYRWTGSAWVCFLSKNFADILDYEKYCVARTEVADKGKGKIPRLDSATGKGNFDIAGSPDRIFDKEIDFQNLQDGHAIVFNAKKNKWVNLPNYTFTDGNLTYTGEASTSALPKIVAVGKDGKIHGDFSGDTDHIGNIPVVTDDLNDKDVLAYNKKTGKFQPVPNNVFSEDNVTFTGEESTSSQTKIVAVGFDGKIHGDFSGKTDHIGDIEIALDGLKNNWILAYNATLKRFEPVGKIRGNADEIAGIKVELDTSTIPDGYVLAYDKASDKFVPVKKDFYTDKDVTTTGEPNKLLKIDENGFIHGKYNSIGNVELEIENLTDGDVFVYHESTQTIKNEPKNIIPATGSGKSLILYDRERVIGDYNGSKTIKIDISKVVSRAGTVSYVNQSMRFIENLYLAFDFNGMNFGGRDGLITEFFRSASDNIDKTSVNVTSIVVGDDSVDVDTTEGLVVGSWYRLTDKYHVEDVQVKKIKNVNNVHRVIFEDPVTKFFMPGKTKLCRSTATFGDGYVTGDEVMFTTKLFEFNYDVGRAHMSVKHERVPDTEISAEMSVHYGAEFVKGEIIGIGGGSDTKIIATLANTDKISSHGFALYFDGVEQTSGFTFSPSDGKVKFAAPHNTVVQADYIYNFSAEDWQEMYRNLTYRDDKNPNRATTQFHYAAQYKNQAGKITAIRLKIKQNSGKVENEILGTGNDKPQGFRLAHHALPETISISPATATWTYKEDLDTIIVTAPEFETIKISYDWKARPIKIDSFAVIFNE